MHCLRKNRDTDWRQTEQERGRETDRQTDRQTDRHSLSEIEIGRQTDRQTDRHSRRWTETRTFNWCYDSWCSWLRTLSGEEEGAFGWISLNYKNGFFTKDGVEDYGVVETGGASTQVSVSHKAESKIVVVFTQRSILSLWHSSRTQWSIYTQRNLTQRGIYSYNRKS